MTGQTFFPFGYIFVDHLIIPLSLQQ
jgi:hypothetical protein